MRQYFGIPRNNRGVRLPNKTCCEDLRGLRIKLRQMGIPVENPCFVFGDNQSVLWNTSVPDSMLKKKTSNVAYHYIREGVSNGVY